MTADRIAHQIRDDGDIVVCEVVGAIGSNDLARALSEMESYGPHEFPLRLWDLRGATIHIEASVASALGAEASIHRPPAPMKVALVCDDPETIVSVRRFSSAFANAAADFEVFFDEEAAMAWLGDLEHLYFSERGYGLDFEPHATHLTIRLHGRVDLPAVLDAFARAHSKRWEHYYRRVWDVRGASDVDLGSADLAELGQFNAAIVRPEGRIAHLVKDDLQFGVLKLILGYADELDHEIFKDDEPAALAWLLGTAAPG